MSVIQDDKELVDGLKGGNKTVIDHIYYTYHKRIYAFALSLLKSEEDAVDIVHEVFVKLWKKRHDLEKDTKIEPLIFTITRNTVLSLFRKRASENKYYDQIAGTPGMQNNASNTEEQVNYTFLREQVDQLVEQLPPKSRRVYLLSRENGLSNKEISRKMGIAEKTVEDHITKALTFLKKHLREIGVTGTLFWYLFVW
ncbi:MAG: RNA polymerase sigma-70 factor [Bacteroidota bacterium]